MLRREFIAGLGSTMAWPVAARAQQPTVPVIGYLGIGNPLSAADNVPLSAADNVAAFREGLSQAGYIEGRNLAIEFHFTLAFPEPIRIMREFATDLVRRQVAVIVAADGPASALAAMAATSTIPIVFVNGADPIRYGFVPRLNRPSSNVTGTTFVTAELEAKRLDLLLQLVPQVSTVAYLLGSSTTPIFENLRNDMLAAAGALKRQIITLEVRGDFEGAFAPLVQRPADTTSIPA